MVRRAIPLPAQWSLMRRSRECSAVHAQREERLEEEPPRYRCGDDEQGARMLSHANELRARSRRNGPHALRARGQAGSKALTHLAGGTLMTLVGRSRFLARGML